VRIFLSYGHDEHTAFALGLKSDLERRGRQVWFDQDRLKPGADWERYLEEGLEWISAERGKVLMLLTPHSVRRSDGYCPNELARACSRQPTVIPLTVSTAESPLSICRRQWLDFRGCVPAGQHEVKYASRFEKLLEAIEHNRPDLEGAQARLQSYLPPIEYDEASRHLPRFTGREWVVREVESWLASGRRWRPGCVIDGPRLPARQHGAAVSCLSVDHAIAGLSEPVARIGSGCDRRRDQCPRVA
jgi:hypothetical protein